MWVSCHLINSVESPLTNRPPLGAGGGGTTRPCSQLVAHHKKDNFRTDTSLAGLGGYVCH